MLIGQSISEKIATQKNKNKMSIWSPQPNPKLSMCLTKIIDNFWMKRV